jgi:hypothetical protein
MGGKQAALKHCAQVFCRQARASVVKAASFLALQVAVPIPSPKQPFGKHDIYK